MRRFLPILLLGFILPGLSADRQVLEEIVARINNEIITKTELEQEKQELRRQLQREYSGASLEEKYRDQELHLLRDLIDQLLLVQRGREMGMSVEADVVKHMDKLREDMGLKSLEELERAVAAQGMSFEDFRERVRRNILTNRVISGAVAGRVFINQDEIQGYYEVHKDEMRQQESYRLREILIATKERSDAEARARAAEVLDKIRHGEKFDALARQYSDAPTAQDGGDLGYFEKGQLAPELEAAVSNLRIDAVSDVLLTRHGYLILQLVEHIPAGVPPLEKVADRIRERLYMQRVQPALREFLNQLREEAYIEVKPGYVDTGAVKKRAPPKRERGRRWRSYRKRQPG